MLLSKCVRLNCRYSMFTVADQAFCCQDSELSAFHEVHQVHLAVAGCKLTLGLVVADLAAEVLCGLLELQHGVGDGGCAQLV